MSFIQKRSSHKSCILTQSILFVFHNRNKKILQSTSSTVWFLRVKCRGATAKQLRQNSGFYFGGLAQDNWTDSLEQLF